jgi:putative ATP-dependent endonuclease of the OLD family
MRSNATHKNNTEAVDTRSNSEAFCSGRVVRQRGEATLKVRHVSIRNFRGIKALSWLVKGDFNCIIGSGDTGKTTILTALDYALSPRQSVAFDDSDFFNQDVAEEICIQVTLSDWDEGKVEIRDFFSEKKFAQYKCGLSDAGPVPEPEPGGPVAISVSLRVDKSLEPKWFIAKGVDEGEGSDRAPLYVADRAVIGASRLDVSSDAQFTWARNTILTRLSAAQGSKNLNAVLSDVAREVRSLDISKYPSVAACQAIADTVKTEAMKTGVNLVALSPRLDVQRQSMSAGALSLHEDNVPLRNKGTGSKRLIASAMQMQLNNGKNIALIDEIEIGLEPHRIRGMIYRLKQGGQQVFTTTHSPVVLRELSAEENELYTCRRDAGGVVVLESLGSVPDIQGSLRHNAEAFLGSKIIACEGATEVGCVRAYDGFRFDAKNPPVWSFATAYLDCKNGGQVKLICPKLVQLGYQTAALCDNDAQDQLSDADAQALSAAGVHLCQWPSGNSTERQVFSELPWNDVPATLRTVADNHPTLEYASIIDNIRKDSRLAQGSLGTDPATWTESVLLRDVIADIAHKDSWIRRIDTAEGFFRFALPKLPETGVLRTKLAALWAWVENVG